MVTEKQKANLIMNKDRSPSELRAMTRKGGIKSGQVRRNLKQIREWMSENLNTPTGVNKEPLYEMLIKKLTQLASQGNIKAIEMLLNYSGLKPIDMVAEVNTKGEDTKREIDIDKLKQLKEVLK